MTPLDPPREPRVDEERIERVRNWIETSSEASAEAGVSLPDRRHVVDNFTLDIISDLRDARAKLAEVTAERDAARLERDERKAWQAVEAEALLERVRRREKQAEQYRIALNKIAYEPIGEPEASDARVYDDIVEIAQAALAESSPPQPQEDPK